MVKEKKWNLFAIGGVAALAVVVYLLFEVKCFSSCDTEIIKPFFMGTIGLIPTLLILLLFGEIFISWLKHIAWWYLLGINYFIFFVSSRNESFLTPDHIQIVMFFMAILFVVTLVYALVMSRRLKKNNS